MKKLERQRAQEEQAKRQEEEEAAAQRSNLGKQLGPGRTQVVACSPAPNLPAFLSLLFFPSFFLFSLPPSFSFFLPHPSLSFFFCFIYIPLPHSESLS